jgi:xylulokinase
MTIQFSLLIDIGGTDLKVGLVKEGQSKLLHVFRYPTPSFLKSSNFRKEISPKELLYCCNMAILKAERVFGPIKSIALSGQMGCWILTDNQNNPLTNVISWQDKRVEEIIPEGSSFLEFAKKIYGQESVRLSGNEIRPGLPIFGMYQYFHENKVNIKLRFHSLISWLSSQLVTKYPYIAHETDFASSGMLNLETKKILSDFNELFKAQIEFPEVTDQYLYLGESKTKESKFFVGVGDQQASLYGSELSSNTVVVNIGTGGQVAALQPSVGAYTNAQVRPYFDGKMIKTLTHLPAGRALTAYAEGLDFEKLGTLDYESILKSRVSENTNIAKRDIVNFEEDVFRIPKPLNSQEKQNISDEVAFQFFQVYRDAIKSLNCEKMTSLIFAGGVGQRFQSLQESLSTEFKTPIHVADTNESTLQGLSFLLAMTK